MAPNTGRFNYIAYDEQAKAQQETFKDLVSNVENHILSFGPGREQSLALTALEECYMWIGKFVRNDQIKRTGESPAQEERTNS